MFRGLKGVRLAGVAIIVAMIGGCAIIPNQSHTTHHVTPVAERDYLTQAVADVKTAPWPKPQSVSFISRMTGGDGGERVTRADAVQSYLVNIQHTPDPLARLHRDAGANLAAAARLEAAAINALSASRLSMNDVAQLENAIMALREHGQIYVAAVKALDKTGAQVSDDAIDQLRDDYRAAIRALGDAADLLAEQVEDDRSRTFATPKNFADL